ncbi:MAG: carboxypeptidase M32 [Gemmatimonadales bacterium]
MKPREAYAELLRLAREETVLASCTDLLEWDEETFMPRGGGDNRAEQMEVLAGLIHERATSPRYGELLAIVESSDLVADPLSPAAVNVRELRREYERELKLPLELVEESARIGSLASQAWGEAREAGDFRIFAPWLEQLFAIGRLEADAVGYPETRYDAMLEDYEPGMTSARIDSLFAGLKEELLPLVAERSEPPSVPLHVLRREFPVDRQRLFAAAVASGLGFDLEAGRIDEAEHPFCTSLGPGDVRLAVRYHPRNFASGFFILLHEVGHGLYDQGVDEDHYGTPMGEAPSLGFHESQSRLWENQVGRSPGFWRHFYPRLRNIFHEALHDIPLDTFLQVVNRVAPGPLRSRADELSYNLHIIIRTELEQAMLDGDLPVAELPGAWAEAYWRYLGVVPRNDTEGCLQDGHWGEGMIGYFPTYVLGNVYAAQLFDQAEADLGPLDAAFGRGEFAGLLGWLRDRIYRQGARYRSADLVAHVTGRAPTPEPLLASFRRRYGGVS